MSFFITGNIPLPTVLITNFVGVNQLPWFSVIGTLPIIYADDTTPYSKCDQSSDLSQQLELASEFTIWSARHCGLEQ